MVAGPVSVLPLALHLAGVFAEAALQEAALEAALQGVASEAARLGAEGEAAGMVAIGNAIRGLKPQSAP